MKLCLSGEFAESSARQRETIGGDCSPTLSTSISSHKERNLSDPHLNSNRGDTAAR